MVCDIMDGLRQIRGVSLGHAILLLIWTFLNLLYSCLHWLMRGLESRLFVSISSNAKSDTAVPRRGIVYPGCKFYAVQRGLWLGVYTTWEECSKLVLGVKGSVYKSFRTRKKAEEFVGLVKYYFLYA